MITPKPKLPRDLLTVEQVAEELQLSQSAVRDYIRTGDLKACKLAGKRKYMVRRADMLAALKPHETKETEI